MNAKKRLFLGGGGISKRYIVHCWIYPDSSRGSE